MKYVIEYTEIMKLDSNILYHLNFIRLKKKIYLPYELVSFEGNAKTLYFSNINEKSLICWNIEKPIETLILKSQKQIWMHFIDWLSIRIISTVKDFVDID